jgi:hypothetical protein
MADVFISCSREGIGHGGEEGFQHVLAKGDGELSGAGILCSGNLGQFLAPPTELGRIVGDIRASSRGGQLARA